jgi:CheY-like chemotaxis protein
MVSIAFVQPESFEGHWHPRLFDACAGIPAGAPRRTLRVVVIDDDRDNADSLATVLRLFGYEAHTAYSGQAGIEAALAVLPDAVLCDLAMPGMDGYTVVQSLRDDPALSGTTFIAESGYGSDGDCARAQSAGFHLHLLKPLDLQRLHEILTECAQRHGLRDPS